MNVVYINTLPNQNTPIQPINMDFPFDYEFVFNDTFDADVFNSYPIVLTDTDDTLGKLVSDVAEMLANLIRLQPGIRCACSFGKHDEQTFKVTVNNTTWLAPN
jgi:hypothetical protein